MPVVILRNPHQSALSTIYLMVHGSGGAGQTMAARECTRGATAHPPMLAVRRNSKVFKFARGE